MTVSKKHQQSFVGDRQQKLCESCGLTMHYLYHNGEWQCESCGSEQEGGFEQFESVEEVTKLAADLKIPKTEAARMLAAKGVL